MEIKLFKTLIISKVLEVAEVVHCKSNFSCLCNMMELLADKKLNCP